MFLQQEDFSIKFITAIIPALIAALLGSWLGALTALSRFKKERAFDRQLQWYERMIGILLDAARELAVAADFEDEFRENGNRKDEALSSWGRVQIKHLEVNRLTAEGVLYARKESYRTLWKETKALQYLANKIRAFDDIASVELKDVDDVKI